jgi:hypothetical protein
MTCARQAISKLDDVQLRGALRTLAAHDRRVVVDMLMHLAEVDARKLHLTWGYSSLWEYCRRDLKLSEGTAGRRVTAARALDKFPVAAEALRSGRVNVCVFATLATVFTADNIEQLLAKAEHLTKRQAEDVAMELSAKPKVAPKKDVIRLVAVVKTAGAMVAPIKAAGLALQDAGSPPPVEVVAEVAAVPEIPEIKVHRVAFNADESVVADLKQLQDLMGQGDLNQIVGRALKLLLDKVDPVRRQARRQKRAAKQQAAKVAAEEQVKAKPTNDRPTVTRRQPAAIRDAAAVRDGGRCSYVSADGVRCGARRHLHIDHVRPFALGGSSIDPENNRVLCAAHNLEMGKRSFGGLRGPASLDDLSLG